MLSKNDWNEMFVALHICHFHDISESIRNHLHFTVLIMYMSTYGKQQNKFDVIVHFDLNSKDLKK